MSFTSSPPLYKNDNIVEVELTSMMARSNLNDNVNGPPPTYDEAMMELDLSMDNLNVNVQQDADIKEDIVTPVTSAAPFSFGSAAPFSFGSAAPFSFGSAAVTIPAPAAVPPAVTIPAPAVVPPAVIVLEEEDDEEEYVGDYTFTIDINPAIFATSLTTYENAEATRDVDHNVQYLKHVKSLITNYKVITDSLRKIIIFEVKKMIAEARIGGVNPVLKPIVFNFDLPEKIGVHNLF